MAETPTPNVSVDEVLMAQAVQEMKKSGNRVKSSVLLVAIVAWLNGNDKTYKHFEEKFPTITVARLRGLIKSNDALSGRVWPVKNDEFGVCLVRIPQ